MRLCLIRLWKQEKLCDVDIIVGTQSLSAHKNILAAASPYFEAAFVGGGSHMSGSEDGAHDSMSSLTVEGTSPIGARRAPAPSARAPRST